MNKSDTQALKSLKKVLYEQRYPINRAMSRAALRQERRKSKIQVHLDRKMCALALYG